MSVRDRDGTWRKSCSRCGGTGDAWLTGSSRMHTCPLCAGEGWAASEQAPRRRHPQTPGKGAGRTTDQSTATTPKEHH